MQEIQTSFGETVLGTYCNQSRFLGRGCDKAIFSEKKGVFSEKGGGNSVNQGLVRISTGKAIQ